MSAVFHGGMCSRRHLRENRWPLDAIQVYIWYVLLLLVMRLCIRYPIGNEESISGIWIATLLSMAAMVSNSIVPPQFYPLLSFRLTRCGWIGAVDTAFCRRKPLRCPLMEVAVEMRGALEGAATKSTRLPDRLV